MRRETYVLSSEMELADIRLIQKAFFKEREAQRFLEKSARPLICERPLKIPRHLVQLLAIRKRIPNEGMKFIVR